MAQAIAEEGQDYPVRVYHPPAGDVGSLINVAGVDKSRVASAPAVQDAVAAALAQRGVTGYASSENDPDDADRGVERGVARTGTSPLPIAAAVSAASTRSVTDAERPGVRGTALTIGTRVGYGHVGEVPASQDQLPMTPATR